MWKSCALLLAGALFLTPRIARACATCACGDPTLTSMGTEQPFAGRLRLATTLRAWGQTEGEQAVDAVSLRELRMDVSAAYAPRSWLFISATLPLQARRVKDVSLTREQSWGPGDMELSAKVYVFRDRDFSPDHLLGVLVGSRLPTSPTLRDAEGRTLSLDAQLGTGSWDPFAGLSYTAFRGEWSFLANTTGYFPTRGREGFRAGASLRTTVAAQYQPSTRWALHLAVDTRLEAVRNVRGVHDPIGSGFIGFLSPDVLFSPTTDAVVQLGVRVPVLNLLRQTRQTPIFQAAVAYDL
ncbi:transporter [Hyalangium gracile]|uniref:transporter n=1 Tax=Hyalangium gracile TaxID=394092 RepID=UPI001CCAFFF4|nr:transporter [Hyalangium gracile]